MSRFTAAPPQGAKAISIMLALILMTALLLTPWASPGVWAQDGTEGLQPAPATDPSPPVADLQPFPISAAAAVLMDVHTGKILYAKNPAMELAPASLAKIMTVVLALEAVAEGRVSLQDRVTISENAWRLSGSSMFLNVGDTVSLEDLLYGIGVVSGNDSALAVAEHLAGSESAFAALMNQRARELGMTNTTFANSHGLLNGGVQKTTAMDMARLARHFVAEHGEGLVYMSTKEYEYGGIKQSNRNGLLFRDQRVTGLKTGFLSAAGYHLVASAQEGDMSLVAAVLGAGGFAQREEEALALLNYGFRDFVTVQPPWGEGGVRTLPVYKGEAKTVVVRPARRPLVTVPRQAAGQITAVDDLPAFLEAPLTAGSTVGQLVITAGDEQVTVPLVVAEDVVRGGFFTVLWDSLRIMVRGLFGR